MSRFSRDGDWIGKARAERRDVLVGVGRYASGLSDGDLKMFDMPYPEHHRGHVHLSDGRVFGPYDFHLTFNAPKGSPRWWRAEVNVDCDAANAIERAGGKVRLVTLEDEEGEAELRVADPEAPVRRLGLESVSDFGPVVTLAKSPPR